MSYLSDDTNTSNQQTEYKPVDEGKYQAVLEDVRYDDTKDDPRISLMWRLGNNMVVWTNLIFKDTTVGILASALEGLGVKESFKAKTKTCEDHLTASKIAFDTISPLRNKSFGITVKHTDRSDGNGVWVNTYINEPMDKIVQNYAPTSASTATEVKSGFDASENMPF